MAKLRCSGCGKGIAMHELEAKTVAHSSGFHTRYRCPFCHEDVENVGDSLV